MKNINELYVYKIWNVNMRTWKRRKRTNNDGHEETRFNQQEDTNSWNYDPILPSCWLNSSSHQLSSKRMTKDPSQWVLRLVSFLLSYKCRGDLCSSANNLVDLRRACTPERWEVDLQIKIAVVQRGCGCRYNKLGSFLWASVFVVDISTIFGSSKFI